MKKLSLLLLGILLIASMVYAKDPEKQTPVYDIMKPMTITGVAKGVDGKAKNEAIYNAKVKFAKIVVNAFVDANNSKVYSKQISYEIYSKLDKYIKNTTPLDNTYVVDKKKKTTNIGVKANVNVTAMVNALDEIDGLKLIDPYFVIKFDGFNDLLDSSTILNYEKEFAKELNDLGGLQAKTVDEIEITRYVNEDLAKNLVDECKKLKVKMIVGVGSLNSDQAALLGFRSSVVDMEIGAISVKTGKLIDYVDGLTGSDTNFFASKKGQADKALKKCLNNLYDYHKNEIKYFILSSWVDIQNEK